jgi:hypothetical protein
MIAMVPVLDWASGLIDQASGISETGEQRADFIKLVSVSGERVLSRRTVPCGVLQRWAYLTAMKAHVSQLPIAETAQDCQIRLVFAPSDEGCDPSIDETEESSADEAEALPNTNRAVVSGASVQQGHRLFSNAAFLSAACRFRVAKAFRDG